MQFPQSTFSPSYPAAAAAIDPCPAAYDTFLVCIGCCLLGVFGHDRHLIVGLEICISDGLDQKVNLLQALLST